VGQTSKYLKELVLSQKELTLQFFSDPAPNSSPSTAVLNEMGANSYLDQVNKFLKVLYTLIHIEYGQPARATEDALMSFINTNNKPRTLYIQRNGFLLNESYHKGRGKTEPSHYGW